MPPGRPADANYTIEVAASDVTYDVAGCYFSSHFRVTMNGRSGPDQLNAMSLRELRAVEVGTDEQLVEMNHPNITARDQPEIWDVYLPWTNGGDSVFAFYDLATAKEVAGLFYHAATLCGGSPEARF
jgi:hypothetical protein